MTESGYFSLDSLPPNTALGYIDNPDGTWKTNIYSLPVKGVLMGSIRNREGYGKVLECTYEFRTFK